MIKKNSSISCREKMETAQEDMKLLGVFGIYQESRKIMAPWRRIFNQIALAFILPLCFIILFQSGLSRFHFSRIPYQSRGERTYTSTDRVVHVRVNLKYVAFPFIFSLLSTSAVVHTIACIYVNREVTFKKFINVIPQVCIRKRLIVTSIAIIVLIFIYIAVAVVTVALCSGIGGFASIALFLIFSIGYIIGFVYITTVCQLASAVTILEESSGIEAMKRSRNLIKGKFRMALSLFFMSNVLVWTIEFVFYNLVVSGLVSGMWKRALIAMFCLALLVTVYLYGLVLQTISYFVCKSYHNEIIDKPTLSQLLGEYERLYEYPNAVQPRQICLIALSKAIKSINIALDQLLTMF